MKSTFLSFLLAIICIMTACNDEPAATTTTPSTPTTEQTFTPVQRAYTRTDTVRFTGDSSRLAVIGILAPGAYLSDSSRNVGVDVLYYIKGQQVSAHTDTFNTRDEEELGHYFEGMDSTGQSCEGFFTVNWGYPACGYNQSHLTFSADASNCTFVCKHISYADGAWGGGLEFFDPCGADAAVQLRSAIVNRGADEDTGDTISVSYSDSTLYRFDGKQWKAQLLTEKEKVYRTTKDVL